MAKLNKKNKIIIANARAPETRRILKCGLAKIRGAREICNSESDHRHCSITDLHTYTVGSTVTLIAIKFRPVWKIIYRHSRSIVFIVVMRTRVLHAARPVYFSHDIINVVHNTYDAKRQEYSSVANYKSSQA